MGKYNLIEQHGKFNIKFSISLSQTLFHRKADIRQENMMRVRDVLPVLGRPPSSFSS
jgi:hypothetical protein